MEHYLEALDMDRNSMKVNHLSYTFIAIANAGVKSFTKST